MLSTIGNVGLWANHFLRPEDLLPPTTTTSGLPPTPTNHHHHHHRGLFARARDPFAHPNPHGLLYAAQLPPRWRLVPPSYPYHHHHHLAPRRRPSPGNDKLRAALEAVPLGLSRPAARVGRSLARGAGWVWCGLCGAAQEAVELLVFVAAALMLAVAAVCLGWGLVAYFFAHPDLALRYLPHVVLEIGRVLLFFSFCLFLPLFLCCSRGWRLIWVPCQMVEREDHGEPQTSRDLSAKGAGDGKGGDVWPRVIVTRDNIEH